MNDTSSQPIELSVKDKRHIFRSLNVRDDVPALFEALKDQISVDPVTSDGRTNIPETTSQRCSRLSRIRFRRRRESCLPGPRLYRWLWRCLRREKVGIFIRISLSWIQTRSRPRRLCEECTHILASTQSDSPSHSRRSTRVERACRLVQSGSEALRPSGKSDNPRSSKNQLAIDELVSAIEEQSSSTPVPGTNFAWPSDACPGTS